MVGLEARGFLVDAARASREARRAEEACESLLRRAELALDEGDPEACQRDLERLGQLGRLPPQLSLREELVKARLCDAEEAGLLYERSLAAAAKARLHQAAGDVDAAQATLTPVMRDLVAVRDKLPEPLREGFRRSPLIRQLLAIGRALEE